MSNSLARSEFGRALKRIMIPLVLAVLTGASGSTMAAAACCQVTEIAADGQVTAAERNGTRLFQFRVGNPGMLRGLRVGSPVFANFDNGQVSLDGRRACCRILRIAKAPASAPARAARPAPAATLAPAPSSPRASMPPPATKAEAARNDARSLAPAAMLAAARTRRLSFGTPQNLPPADWRDGAGRLLQYQRKNVLQLHGRDGIKRAAGLPQAARDILLLHARTRNSEDLDSYIVIPEEAQAWADALPDEMRRVLRKAAADDGKEEEDGCSWENLSWNCVEVEVEQLTEQAQNVWDDIADEWGRLMGRTDEAAQCFKERTLRAEGPVRFGIAPQIPLSFESNSSSSSRSGSAVGNVQGDVTIGLPIAVQAAARLEVFYIPCLPFVVRPKSLGAEGSLGVEAVFDARVVATGAFDYLFTVPPAGGVQIPVAVIPVVLGGVPIAVVDVSVYLDGTLQVDGDGTLDGRLRIQSLQESAFYFECSGHGCKVEPRGDVAEPVNAVQSMKLDGRIRLKPAIYSALQLGLNYNVLNVRAGPQPYLVGEIRGCVAAEAAQSTTGASSAEAIHALTADLDWGLEIRAEALAGGRKVEGKIWRLQQEHLFFEDLAQSTALVPAITGSAHAAAGQPAAFILRMPSCYPYTDAMRYQVRWTGNAGAPAAAPRTTLVRAPARRPSAAAGSTNTDCMIEPGQASCRGAPSGDTQLYLAWPASGDYRLAVTPVEDAHGRRFDTASAEWAINVSP